MRSWIRGFLGATCVALLSACGGGGSPAATPAATTLGGTAAVGAPIVGGTVDVTCAGGTALSTTSSSTGAWQVTISGQTLPCAIRISGGTVNAVANATSYHSVAMAFGIANITPLTDLITANLAGAAPGTWFGGLSGSTLRAITQNQIDTALANVRTALGLTTALNGADPITTAFTAANGNLLDDILEALAAAGAAYADLLNNAQAGSFSAPVGFDFQTAFTTVRAANAGGGGSCTAGQTSLTYAASTSGGPHTDGQVICFTTISSTSLVFPGKSLTNPVQNNAVTAPFSAYQFADGAFTYEVVFNNGALHEINVSDSSRFYGQLTASAGGSGGGSGGLEISVLVNGVAGATFNIPSIPAPQDQASFCSALASDSTFASIGTAGGGTLVVTSCSYANNIGTVNATLLGTIPYVVTYRYQ
jgi:hypothetical protein